MQPNNYIGIDFSLRSTSITILDDKGNIKKIAIFIRKDVYKGKCKRLLNILEENNIFKVFTTNLTEKSEIYSQIELNKINNMSLIDNIIEFLIDYKDCKIGIEGFSYNSISNSCLDLAGMQYILRYLMINKITKNLYFYSPSEIKKFATNKGNANKELIKKFTLSNSDLSVILKDFIQKSYKEDFNFISDDIKPYDDMCDSYWIAKLLFKNNQN